MTTEERRALLDRAITTYGAPAQMDMAVEEMAELTKALCLGDWWSRTVNTEAHPHEEGAPEK